MNTERRKMIHPDVLNDWYSTAKMIVEREPEATLWDLFRFKMMWEHSEDIDSLAIEFICPGCNQDKEHHAKGLCYTCYVRVKRREAGNETK